jgi:hypothetical protein
MHGEDHRLVRRGGFITITDNGTWRPRQAPGRRGRGSRSSLEPVGK